MVGKSEVCTGIKPGCPDYYSMKAARLANCATGCANVCVCLHRHGRLDATLMTEEDHVKSTFRHEGWLATCNLLYHRCAKSAPAGPWGPCSVCLLWGSLELELLWWSSVPVACRTIPPATLELHARTEKV
jgi:hypothetical protein